MAHTCHPSSAEVEAGGVEVQDLPWKLRTSQPKVMIREKGGPRSRELVFGWGSVLPWLFKAERGTFSERPGPVRELKCQ